VVIGKETVLKGLRTAAELRSSFLVSVGCMEVHEVEAYWSLGLTRVKYNGNVLPTETVENKGQSEPMASSRLQVLTCAFQTHFSVCLSPC